MCTNPLSCIQTSKQCSFVISGYKLWCSQPLNLQRLKSSNQQHHNNLTYIITVRAISKKSSWGDTKTWVHRVDFITCSCPYLFCVLERKGTKKEPYWLRTSKTEKQQDTTDRSCMAGIRIKVEREQRRKRTTKETGNWQTFFFLFLFFLVKRME